MATEANNISVGSGNIDSVDVNPKNLDLENTNLENADSGSIDSGNANLGSSTTRDDSESFAMRASSENLPTQARHRQTNQKEAPVQLTQRIEEVLATEGFYMGPPVGVSMWPMLRNRRDVMLVVPAPANEALHRYDVALYRRGSSYVLHRVVDFYEKGYVICGDNCVSLEHIPRENVLGVLQGFYRDGRYTPCATSRPYHAYAKIWVALFPARRFCKNTGRRAKHLVKRALMKLDLWKKRSECTTEKAASK